MGCVVSAAKARASGNSDIPVHVVWRSVLLLPFSAIPLVKGLFIRAIRALVERQTGLEVQNLRNGTGRL